MEYKDQIDEINKKLRLRADGLKGIQLSIDSGVPQPIISNWLRGLNVSYGQLSKLAKALGMKITVKLEQDWKAGEEGSNG